MRVTPTDIPEVLILSPNVFNDNRGYFCESFNQRTFRQLTGIDVRFVQENYSHSSKAVLRGLHYQIEHAQGKLIRVLQGRIYDVALDIRRYSPTVGKWVGVELCAEGLQQLWIPPGFAHGFMVLSDTADILYKTTDYYYPEHERCIRWNDPDLAIDWPTEITPILSVRDESCTGYAQSPLYEMK